MPQLTERCELWRAIGTYDGGKTIQPVYTLLPCLRVPVSSFDKVAAALAARNSASTERFGSEARESTDVFLIPAWVVVMVEDELRRGRRVDINGNAVPYRYTVDGIRDYEALAYQDTVALYCQSLQ